MMTYSVFGFKDRNRTNVEKQSQRECPCRIVSGFSASLPVKWQNDRAGRNFARSSSPHPGGFTETGRWSQTENLSSDVSETQSAHTGRWRRCLKPAGCAIIFNQMFSVPLNLFNVGKMVGALKYMLSLP